jgi:flagellin
MSLVINTNISSLMAQNNLSKSQSALSSATQRLSSGMKINSAADNAAGFAISQRYTTQIGGLGQASANASDAINLAQTAGSALDQVTANLQAIRDLAVQSANGTYTSTDRASIDQEVQQRLAEITRIANQTTFNGSNVLDGSMKTKSFQIGASVGQTISVSLGTSVKASAVGQVAEVSTGSINTGTGFTLASGALTVNVGGAGAVSVAAGTYKTVSSLASAINTAAGSNIAAVDATSGELKITGPTGGVAFGGAAQATLGITAAVAAAGTGASTAAVASTGDPSNETLTINGTKVSLAGAQSLQDVSDAINAAGVSGVSAAVNANGNGLNFYSSSALTVSDTVGTSAAAGSIIGANAKDANTGVAFASGNTASTGGSLATGNVQSVDSANDLISRVDVALQTVSNFAAQLGAVQNRFQSTISTVAAQTTNLQASQSTIRDADFAAETANMSKANVLQQAGISVLAQANSNPQQVLKLLQ